jgi:hypothetical protein
MLARIGVNVLPQEMRSGAAPAASVRALNRRVERVFDLPRKDHHWGRRTLRRDQ